MGHIATGPRAGARVQRLGNRRHANTYRLGTRRPLGPMTVEIDGYEPSWSDGTTAEAFRPGEGPGARVGKGDLAARLGIRPFAVDTLLAQAHHFDSAQLLRALDASSLADRRLKGSGLPPPLGLAALRAQIC